MFDFGNDDKEKLRENMEQIKEMVNQGKSMSDEENLDEGFDDQELGDFEQAGFDSPQGDLQDQGSGGTAPEQAGTESFDDSAGQQSQEEELEQELDEFEEKFEDSPSQDTSDAQQGTSQAHQGQPQQTGRQNMSGQTGQPQQSQGGADQEQANTAAGQQTNSQEGRSNRNTRDLSREVPSPPETRELDVPDIDRGPLFLRQRKFLKAKKMIEDMLYLKDEMEKTVNDLEAGLHEDQEIEREVVDILKEFEDDRDEVEDIISPREE
ncbi:MAG: hypothetical protein ABEI07_01570 [Candidatus Nanohaloarchaea archaeon]